MWRRRQILLPLDTPVVPLSIGTNGLSPDALRVLSLYGVRDVLADTRTPPLHITGLHLVYNGYDARIYANDAVLPRTWLVTGQDVVKNAGQALTRVVAPGFDPRRSVLTVQRLPGLAEHQTGGTTPGTAHITHYGTEQVTITARATSAGRARAVRHLLPGVEGHRQRTPGPDRPRRLRRCGVWPSRPATTASCSPTIRPASASVG